VHERERPLYTLPAAFASGEVEIQRGDLSRILYEASRAHAEYLFGDQIIDLTTHADGVDVQLASGARRRVDLVIGADGLHSGVRALAFGSESDFLRCQGYHVAIFGMPNHLQLDHSGVICGMPGRAAALSSARAPERATGMFVFRSSAAWDCGRRDPAEQRWLIQNHYAGMTWQVPRMLDAMWRADDLYFDQIAHVAIDRYASGRVALLGDAASAPSAARAVASSSSAPTCWQGSWRALAEITPPRSAATSSRCAPTPKLARSAASASARSTRRAIAPSTGYATDRTKLSPRALSRRRSSASLPAMRPR